MAPTILIGEDEPVQRKMISMLLKKLGYRSLLAENGKEVLKQVRESNFGEIDAVLLDLAMPEMNGFEALKALRQYRPDLPVLILTAQDDTAAAVAAIKEGASDFILKPAQPEQLDIALKNAIRLSTLSRELTRLKRDREGALGFHDVIGHEGGLKPAVDYARKAAASDIPVLITGEISTGKELLARAIHGESRRTGAPFIAVDCRAIPQAAIEAALFGQAGARAQGKIREAERGTVFLDDIDALPPDTQAKLLRLLQQHEIEAVGAEKPVKVNVRVISASGCDLKQEVKAGRFREDLYFRLNVLPIAMPPLRARKADILPLAEYFLHRLASLDALPLKTLGPDARHYLTDYAWPGNLRELEGLIHRALVLSEGDVITRAFLAHIHATDSDSGSLPPQGEHIALYKPNGLPKTMAEIEAEVMRHTLAHYKGHIARAAEALSMAKSTFYRKLKATPGG